MTTDPYVSGYKVGDIVILSSVIDDVKKSFLKTPYIWTSVMNGGKKTPYKWTSVMDGGKKRVLKKHYIWSDRMIDMLGKQYPVLEVVSGNGLHMIGLPSPDGPQNGKWYFPESVVSRQGATKPVTSSTLKGNKN